MEKELRRSQSTLQILGIGVVAFTLWDLMRPFLTIFLGIQDQAETGAATSTLEASPVLVTVLLGVFFMSIIIIPLRIYIGLSARAEGRGKRKNWTYVVLAVVVLTEQAALFAVSVWSMLRWGVNSMENIAALLVDASSLVTTWEMIKTAEILRKLRKKLDQAG